MADKTILPDDMYPGEQNNPLEEGDNSEGTSAADSDAAVSDEEKELLEEASTTDPTYTEELRMRNAKADTTDEDGDTLNEGDELDVPGSELDEDQEQKGAEDEENNEIQC